MNDFVLVLNEKIQTKNTIIGIDDDLNIYRNGNEPIKDSELTLDEKIELSKIMVQRWEDYKLEAKIDLMESR